MTGSHTHCRKGHEKTPDNVYLRKDGRGVVREVCATCVRASQKGRRRNPETKRVQQHRYYLRNRETIRAKRNEAARMAGPRIRTDIEKERARWRVRAAVRGGKLTKPNNCEQCGRECNVHGHHDDYAKPLEVRWLCTWCHAAVHASERRAS